MFLRSARNSGLFCSLSPFNRPLVVRPEIISEKPTKLLNSRQPPPFLLLKLPNPPNSDSPPSSAPPSPGALCESPPLARRIRGAIASIPSAATCRRRPKVNQDSSLLRDVWKIDEKSSKEEQISPCDGAAHQHSPERSLCVRKLKCPMCSDALCSRTFVQLPCHHYFHMHCVPWWKGDCSFCPICQAPVDHVEWVQAA